MHTCLHTCIHTCIHAYTHTHMHACTLRHFAAALVTRGHVWRKKQNMWTCTCACPSHSGACTCANIWHTYIILNYFIGVIERFPFDDAIWFDMLGMVIPHLAYTHLRIQTSIHRSACTYGNIHAHTRTHAHTAHTCPQKQNSRARVRAAGSAPALACSAQAAWQTLAPLLLALPPPCPRLLYGVPRVCLYSCHAAPCFAAARTRRLYGIPGRDPVPPPKTAAQ